MKKGVLLLSLVMIFCASWLTLSCDAKRPTIGSLGKIIAIADTTIWLQIEPQARAAAEKELLTPQPEKMLTLVYASPYKLGDLKRYPTLWVIATLDSADVGGELLNLSGEIREKVTQEGFYFTIRKDYWAKNQILAIAIAKDVASLKEQLASRSDFVFEALYDNVRDLIAHDLLEKYEQKEIEKTLLQKHGWSVRVPHDFVVAIDSTEVGFVWLRRFNPQRWFAVYYEKTDDPAKLTKEWLIQTRDRLTQQFYEGDFIYQKESVQAVLKEIDFKGRYTLRLDGVWQNDRHLIGGPFRSFGFYNPSDGRLYLIDCAVYAPGERKWQYMRQLEAMAFTFITK